MPSSPTRISQELPWAVFLYSPSPSTRKRHQGSGDHLPLCGQWRSNWGLHPEHCEQYFCANWRAYLHAGTTKVSPSVRTGKLRGGWRGCSLQCAGQCMSPLEQHDVWCGLPSRYDEPWLGQASLATLGLGFSKEITLDLQFTLLLVLQACF